MARRAHAHGARAIGYAATAIDVPPETYANVARTTLDALGAYAADVARGAPDPRRHSGKPAS
jgi:3-methyl-2-oxobutanoate hydroxymethyltransferase